MYLSLVQTAHISRVEFWVTKAFCASLGRALTSDPLEHREKSLVTVVQVAADDLDGDGFASCNTLTDPDLALAVARRSLALAVARCPAALL